MSKKSNKSGGRADRPYRPYKATVAAQQGTKFDWGDLQSMHDTAAGLLALPQTIRPLIADPVTLTLPQGAEILQRGEIIVRDAELYRERLAVIQARHAGRTGDCTKPDDLMAVIQLAEQYVEWEESFNSVLLPNLDFIQNAYANLEKSA